MVVERLAILNGGAIYLGWHPASISHLN